MRGFGVALRAQIARDLLRAGRGVPVVDRAVEQREGCDGLVVGDLVAGFVDAREGEVAVFAGLAVFDAVDGHGDVAGGVEFVGVCVVEGFRDGFAAEPVAGGGVSGWG